MFYQIMSARKENNLWNLIIILSLLPLIKSHSDASGLNFNKSCENLEHFGSNLLNLTQNSGNESLQNNKCYNTNNLINPGDEFDFKFDYSEFNLNFTSDEISSECRNSIQILEQRAKLLDLNALKSEKSLKLFQ